MADGGLGKHITIIMGAVLMAVGLFMRALEPLFLFALVFLICGNGCFKPNMSAQVGGLYAPGDHRRDRAYSIFYVGINVGASSRLSSAARSARSWAGIMGSLPPVSA